MPEKAGTHESVAKAGRFVTKTTQEGHKGGKGVGPGPEHPLPPYVHVGIVTLMLAQDDKEHPVPEEIRPRFQELVAAFVAGDYRLSRHTLDGIAPIDENTAQFIAGQIAAYGATLAPLNDEVWRRSIYLWMDG